MVFIFDENYSFRLAKGLHELELGNQNKKNVKAEIWDILSLAEHLKIKPKDNSPKSSFTDEEVIEIAGKKNGVIITQDNDFKRTKHYYQLYKEHKVGVIIFKTVVDSRGYWNMVNSIIKRWHDIKTETEKKHPPFCYFIDKNSMKECHF